MSLKQERLPGLMIPTAITHALLSAGALLLTLLPRVVGAADLEVQVLGLAHDRGLVYLALYDRAEGFLDQTRSLRRGRCPARPTQSPCLVWRGLPPGDYAVTVYHDEDDDGHLDLLMGVAPAEGFGVSNEGLRHGRPTFDEARVHVPDEGLRLSIALHYPPPAPSGFGDELH